MGQHSIFGTRLMSVSSGKKYFSTFYIFYVNYWTVNPPVLPWCWPPPSSCTSRWRRWRGSCRRGRARWHRTIRGWGARQLWWNPWLGVEPIGPLKSYLYSFWPDKYIRAPIVRICISCMYTVGRLMVYTFCTPCSFFLRGAKVIKIGGKVALSFFYTPEVILSKSIKGHLSYDCLKVGCQKTSARLCTKLGTVKTKKNHDFCGFSVISFLSFELD